LTLLQYKIEYNIRLNDKVTRDLLLPAIGAVVQFLVRSTGDDRSIRADMKAAQHVVIIEIFKSTCGISVIDGELYRKSKRLNIDALAQELIKAKAQPHEDGVPAQEGSIKVDED
jgi:tRNA(Ser,Leu) C12 N-acetylase TAN1